MSHAPLNEVNDLLANAGRGNAEAADRLFPIVYHELRALAGDMFRFQGTDHTLQPTALVHEAYLRLVNQQNGHWKDRTHFMAVAAKVMRNLLIDHARKRKAGKRGDGWERITLDGVLDTAEKRSIDLLSLEEALQQLSEMDERKARVVELRFFGGLTIRETAQDLGVARATVEEDWAMARAWLTRRLAAD